MERMKENIFLIGFSGTGKTSVGKQLAKQLGFEYIDSDLQIEADTGRSVQHIFAEDGEATFRAIEAQVIENICEGNFQVVATGGGVVLSKANRTAMTANGYVIALDARPETIYVRLLLDSTNPANVRPLLQGADQFERITALKNERAPLYTEADWTIHTDFLTTEEVAAEIERALPLLRRRSDKQRGGPGSPATPGSPHSTVGKVSPTPFHRGEVAGVIGSPTDEPNLTSLPGQVLPVRSSAGVYPVVFAENLLPQLGELLRKTLPGSAGRAAFIITDEAVGGIYGETVTAALAAGGYRPYLTTIPAGEESKALAQAEKLYNWLAQHRAERKDFVIALGGGVVGDLAGFVAATWLRGLNFVQVPTTLLAMVDSSVGGKTGVNHPAGKNLIGAFYPPRAVFADVLTLTSLPERARRSGWAEVVKHAIIPGISGEAAAVARLERLENAVHALNAGDMALTAAILHESVGVKAGVVEEDEREASLRMTLNYGHTFAHAIENAAGYGTLLHGEAVAIGLHGVARLAQELKYCTPEFVARQKALLEAFGLPTSAREFQINREAALASLQLDKKAESGAVRWIIPRGVGRLEIRRDIPPAAVANILDELVGSRQ
jgi:shikimate kinase / 3-dehydroquinate synthase